MLGVQEIGKGKHSLSYSSSIPGLLPDDSEWGHGSNLYSHRWHQQRLSIS